MFFKKINLKVMSYNSTTRENFLNELEAIKILFSEYKVTYLENSLTFDQIQIKKLNHKKSSKNEIIFIINENIYSREDQEEAILETIAFQCEFILQSGINVKFLFHKKYFKNQKFINKLKSLIDKKIEHQPKNPVLYHEEYKSFFINIIKKTFSRYKFIEFQEFIYT